MTGRSPAPSAPGRTSRVADAVVFVAASALLGAVAGLPAAWVWAKVAHPPAVPLTEQGVVFGEVQLNQQSEVTLWFLVVGFGFGLVAGAVVGWRGERHGVVTVAAVLALCAAGAGLTALAGISVFGPDEQAQAAGADVGAVITTSLRIGSPVAYVGWPIGGLLGACVAISRWPIARNEPFVAEPSSNLVVEQSSMRGS